MSARCSPERVQELIQRWRNQCLVARWLGEQAVGVIRRELAQAWEAGRTTSRTTSPPDPVVPPEEVDLADVLAAAAHAEDLDAEGLPPTVTHAPAAPFDGYDTLPASHIVQRLRRMSPDELRRAAAYEAAHRQRSTVLGMVEQLLDG